MKEKISGYEFDGFYIDNKKEQKGKMITEEWFYKGNFKDDKFHGKGSLKYP